MARTPLSRNRTLRATDCRPNFMCYPAWTIREAATFAGEPGRPIDDRTIRAWRKSYGNKPGGFVVLSGHSHARIDARSFMVWYTGEKKGGSR